MSDKVSKLLKRYNLSAVNKAEKMPSGPKSHHVLVKVPGFPHKHIRFGQRGAITSSSKGSGLTKQQLNQKRKRFFSRHRKNIALGKLHPAWWAAKVKWPLVK